MEKIYYIIYQNEKNGPFSKEELLEFNLNEDTLIWRIGFSNWTKFSKIPEFNDINTEPPPLPLSEKNANDININLNMSRKSNKNPFKKSFLQKLNIRIAKQLKYLIFSILLGLIVTPILFYFILVNQKYFIYEDEIVRIENSINNDKNSEYYKEVVKNEDIFSSSDFYKNNKINANSVIQKLNDKKDRVLGYSKKDLPKGYLLTVISLYIIFLLISIIKWIFKTSKIKY